MPLDNSQFAKELGKLARLGAVKNSLPSAMRIAPVAAIAVGAVLSQAVTGKEDSNFVEDAMIGKGDEVTLLGPPPSESLPAARGKESADGEGKAAAAGLDGPKDEAATGGNRDGDA